MNPTTGSMSTIEVDDSSLIEDIKALAEVEVNLMIKTTFIFLVKH